MNPSLFASLLAKIRTVLLASLERIRQSAFLNRELITDSRWFFAFLTPHRRKAIGAAIWMGLGVLLRLPLPLLTMFLIDTVLAKRQESMLVVVCVGLIGILILQVLSNLLCEYLLVHFREKATIEIERDLFSHIQRLPLSFFHAQHTGYLISRVSDVSSAQGLMAETILEFFRESLTLIVGLCLIFIIHWRLAVLSMALLPFFLASLAFFSKRLRNLAKDVREKDALVAQALQEKFASIHLIKAFSNEMNESANLECTLNADANAKIKSGIWSRVANLGTAMIGSIAPIIVLWYGGNEVIQNRLSLGQLVAFNSFLGYLFNPAQRLFGLNTTVQQALAAVQRLREAFSWKEEPFDTRSQIGVSTGSVQFRNVWFSYRPDQPVLKDINFEAFPGQIVALVGKSGAGKSSLVNLIPRFFEATRGVVLLDNVDIRRIDLHRLRRSIGIVHQEPLLFDRSVAENIRYGKPTASLDEVILACKQANAYDFVSELPRGLMTSVGERGVTLSVGQKQRLALARAILADPKILILDEPTSSVDSLSEQFIRKSIEDISPNRTVFVIAHRLSTVMSASLILVLHEGRIVGSGTHSQLLAGTGLYAELCSEQFNVMGNSVESVERF